MNCPLVSVLILTYNSSKYILDALESVKNQTYQNIELIVTDDCSKDDTVAICRNWINQNKHRFVDAILVTTERNTGTSANSNRGLVVCKGEWLKILAGDDALFPDCVTNFVDYINIHKEAKFVVGKGREYKYTFDDVNETNCHVKNYNNNPLLKESVDVQFKNMLHGDWWILTPAVFYNVNMLRMAGGWDEKYGVHEDFPMFHKLLKEGYKCYELDEYVVKYRLSDSNVYGNINQLFNYKHMRADFQIKKDLCFPYYSLRERIRTYTYFASCWIMNKLGLQKRTFFNISVFAAIRLFFAVLTLDFGLLWSYFKSYVLRINHKHAQL